MTFFKNDAISDFTFKATKVWFTRGRLNVCLADGRTISNPLSLYPFLLNAPPESLKNFRLLGGGTAIHFGEIDEDISVTDIVLGIPYFDGKTSPTKKV